MTIPFRKWLVAGLAAASLLVAPQIFAASAACPVGSSMQPQELPRQAQDTLELILRGGPFASDRDGIIFGNRERMLPRAPRGFYREYTVRTPAARNRGARRIVCGGDQRSLAACYYSGDHYQSFKCIQR